LVIVRFVHLDKLWVKQYPYIISKICSNLLPDTAMLDSKEFPKELAALRIVIEFTDQII
jgi:hypothetical protein